MVAPTQGLEYRPTIYLWLILFFGVFPMIYLMGQVAFCILAVVFRILRGLFRFLYFDDEITMDECEEQLRKAAKLERKRRRHQRVHDAQLAQQTTTNGTIHRERKARPLAANGTGNGAVTSVDVNQRETGNFHQSSHHVAANLTPPTTADMPSDVSDSLASEYDDEIAKLVGNGVKEQATLVADKVQNLD